MKQFFLFVTFVFLAVVLIRCQQAQEEAAATQSAEALNPPAEGFNLQASDPKAIEVADEVMSAMGGRAAWDNTQHIKWNFFGRRLLVWDKLNGRARIEIPGQETVMLLDLSDGSGRVMKSGEVMEHPDSVATYVDQGMGIWINDSYWLVMPFKLKDSGVTLTYAEEGQTADGLPADVLQLTFEEVGRTPQNRYLVYVDKASRLVTQWDFFRNASDEAPLITTPWANYQPHGQILLSGDRGERKLTEIAVYDELPEAVYTSFEAVDWASH